MSLIHKRVYQALKNPPKLIKKYVNLQSVNGNPLDVVGCVNICFQIKNVTLSHSFYVVGNMNRNIILGHDWLVQNGVRLYYDLGCLRIGQMYVPLEEDIHIASIVRVKTKTIIKPQTANVCLATIKNNSELNQHKIFQISQIDTGYISSEPGLMLSNAVIKIDNTRQFPIMIVNNTDKTFTLRRGCIIGKIEAIQEESISSINSINKNGIKNSKINTDEINVSKEHKQKIEKNNIS